ncbi:endonuclease/exonuclease/phosphatase family metal-dependent hydrolase [Pedobacter sp. CG_S7]|uniref:endonuclease/exonuclease/phosphatase family protein n=1 Tax=Pedobacter sp. CG_S7 TaxID=3143930 RepID=UPI0033971EF2
MNPFYFAKQLLFVTCIFLFSSCAQKINKKTVVEGDNLRVMSYNIHHCNPPAVAGKIDIEAIANVIKAQNPDLVALQEVDVNTIRSGKINQARFLAEMLGMNFYFAKAIDHEGGDYGVAILSKYPISENKIHHLTTQADTKGEPRVLATVLVSLPNGKKFRLGTTHLDAQKADTNRLLQVRELNAIAQQEKLPFIIAGDLNAMPGSTAINLFDEQYFRTCEDCEFTIPIINPKRTIDFIGFTNASPFEVISHNVIPERFASDHLPLLSVLKFKSIN